MDNEIEEIKSWFKKLKEKNQELSFLSDKIISNFNEDSFNPDKLISEICKEVEGDKNV